MRAFRNMDDMIHVRLNIVITLGDNPDYRSMAGTAFLDIADHLVPSGNVINHGKHRRLLIQQGDRAVLEFRRMIAFGMDMLISFSFNAPSRATGNMEPRPRKKKSRAW